MKITKKILKKANRIKLVLSDCDGVLTDTGVYYSANGEELKKFSLRDGMGVERLREIVKIETGIVSGEDSPIVRKRAEKLEITHLYLGVKNKALLLEEIIEQTGLSAKEIAFIGDDTNDLEIMEKSGLCACPADAVDSVKEIADITLTKKGGQAVFREFAELIIASNISENMK